MPDFIQLTFAFPDPKVDNVIFIAMANGEIAQLQYEDGYGWVDKQRPSEIFYHPKDIRISSGFTKWMYKKDLMKTFDLFSKNNIVKEDQ